MGTALTADRARQGLTNGGPGPQNISGEKYPTCVRDIDPGCQHLHNVGPECQLTPDC